MISTSFENESLACTSIEIFIVIYARLIKYKNSSHPSDYGRPIILYSKDRIIHCLSEQGKTVN